MKISYNWLKEYVDFDYSPQELAKILTATGLETGGIEKFESVKGGLEGVFVGEVLSCKKHPNADKLSVTTVDTGQGDPLPVVCGAPNVAKGQKVLVATVGSVIYPDPEKPLPIKKAKIRGEVSEGMICAEDELGLGTSHAGIMVLDNDAETGRPASDLFDIKEDWTLEIDLTPNRADATSHIGVARDVVAYINRMNPEADARLKVPSVDGFSPDNDDLHIPVQIADKEACPRYSALTISGVEVKESPSWLKNKLKAAGLRPVNNVVDATNYVMLETGHPLHPFNADRIKDRVIVKKMPEATAFTTLDGVERKLGENDLMICDAEGPMCIAGVFGGIDSGVKENTKNIFLESAYFDPAGVRKSSKKHQLKTDASFRFERGADPAVTVYALKRAAMLIKQLAGGEISSDIVDENPGDLKPWEVNLAYDRLNRLAGTDIGRKTATGILKDLGMEVLKDTDEELTVSVPTFKVDVKRDVDLIEEILRIYGYNQIPLPDRMKISLSFSEKPDRDKLTNLASDFLSANGFAEVINNSLTAERYAELSNEMQPDAHVKLLNPLSRDLNVMRQSLLTSGLENVIYNLNRQTADMMFYEMGKTYRLNPEVEKNENVRGRFREEHHLSIFLTGRKYHENWNTTDEHFSFYDLHHWVKLLLERLGIDMGTLKMREADRDYLLQGLEYRKGKTAVAVLGKVNSRLLKQFDIGQDVYFADLNWDSILEMSDSGEIKYRAVPKFPEVRRDLAMILNRDVVFEDIRKLAFEKERKLLRSVNLFDVYEGSNIPEGKKSYAVSFVLQDPQKTLNDKQIDKVMQKLQKSFEEKLQAEIRG